MRKSASWVCQGNIFPAHTLSIAWLTYNEAHAQTRMGGYVTMHRWLHVHWSRLSMCIRRCLWQSILNNLSPMDQFDRYSSHVHCISAPNVVWCAQNEEHATMCGMQRLGAMLSGTPIPRTYEHAPREQGLWSQTGGKTYMHTIEAEFICVSNQIYHFPKPLFTMNPHCSPKTNISPGFSLSRKQHRISAGIKKVTQNASAPICSPDLYSM